MINPLTWLSRRRFPYEPLIKIEISKSRLIHNLNDFRKISSQGRIAPVLKSNAYGHGLAEVANILEEAKDSDKSLREAITFFVVDSYFEAVALRAKGIKTPLLIIGYTRPETILHSKLPQISYTVSNMETLRSLEKASRQISIHLKIDTGMRRQGIMPTEADEAIRFIKDHRNISLQGITSHLCDADSPDRSFTEKQISVWNGLVDKFRLEFPTLEYIHLSATDGHRYSSSIKANLSRLGLGLYGLAINFDERLDQRPILEMKTVITGVKKLAKDETVGYGRTFAAAEDMTIATIPVGYFEGIDRRLSNAGTVAIANERDQIECPIIGRVSMNISSIDVSNIKNASIGAEVTVICNDPSKTNSIRGMAEICKTIEYEVVVHIPEHLKRTIVS